MSQVLSRQIIQKMDVNADNLVNEKELEDWIQHVQQKSIQENVYQQWLLHNPDNLTILSWDMYRSSVYGPLDDTDNDVNEETTKVLNMLFKDQRRWKLSDIDGDQGLTMEEFQSFLHADQYEHMRQSVILDAVDDMDTNKDGVVSMEEFIGDLHKGEGEEPDWVKHQREQFANFHDHNKDGFLDGEELGHWIAPLGFNGAAAEAIHLMQECDLNQDGFLTQQEIFEKYDVFMGSQVTDFGQALTVTHDEL